MHRRLLAILMTALSVLTLSSQELEWSVDMNAVFNNREGGKGEFADRTFLFTRITPQVGVSMHNREHRIMGGVTWYQPMIDDLQGYKVQPSLFYEYKNKTGVDFKFGVIPNELKSDIPTYLRSDSVNYVQPNIKGLAINVQKTHFWFYSWVDWRQFRTDSKREAFDVTGQLGWRTRHGDNDLWASAILRYNHLAKCYHPPLGIEENVVDNVLFNPSIAYGHRWDNVNVNIQAGMLLTCDRDRIGDSKWLTQAGFIGTLRGSWKWLSLIENFYTGKEQMPLLEKYGSLLYQGDPYYHSKLYSRTDLVATIFQKDFINLEARLTFHATDKTTAFWQQLAVRFYLDNKIWKHHKNKPVGVDLIPLAPQF